MSVLGRFRVLISTFCGASLLCIGTSGAQVVPPIDVPGSPVAGSSAHATDDLSWMGKQAEAGDSGGQFDLGNAYVNGQQGTVDPKAAVMWWTRAAQQGHPGAQYALGHAYQHGRGVPRDLATALQWYKSAAT
jgi:TPR repeat protein